MALILDTLIDLDVITEAYLHKVNVERKWKAQLSHVELEKDVKTLDSDSDEGEPMIRDLELPAIRYSESRRAKC